MAAFRVGTAYPHNALYIVTASRKALAQLLDALKAVPAEGGGILLIVVLAEVSEVPLEYSMEFVTATGNVPVYRRGRDGDYRAHINIYGINELPASQGGRIHGTPHKMAHPPDAFSSLRSYDGADDASCWADSLRSLKILIDFIYTPVYNYIRREL